jgi:hypothetical protein
MAGTLTRRGFTRALLLGGAGALLTRPAAAQPASARLIALPLHQPQPGRLAIELAVQNPGRETVRFPVDGLTVRGAVQDQALAHAVRLHPESGPAAGGVGPSTLAHAGRRHADSVLVGPGEVVSLGVFAATWPASLASEAAVRFEGHFARRTGPTPAVLADLLVEVSLAGARA